MFYLFMRSIAEKELSIVINRIVTGDIRNVKVPVAKCLKLAKIYSLNSIGDEKNL